MSKEPEIKFSKIHVSDRYGGWYAIGTKRGWLEFRVTPSGFIRVGKIEKGKHPYFTPVKP